MKTKATYRVEILEDNEWIAYSPHKNEENAIIIAKVIHKSRKYPVRVIKNGKIIFSLP